jgi:excisionase family DNA binding protein
MSTPVDKSLVTVEELAQILGCGKTKAWELVRSKTIPAVRVDRLVRIRVEDIHKYLSEHPY